MKSEFCHRTFLFSGTSQWVLHFVSQHFVLPLSINYCILDSNNCIFHNKIKIMGCSWFCFPFFFNFQYLSLGGSSKMITVFFPYNCKFIALSATRWERNDIQYQLDLSTHSKKLLALIGMTATSILILYRACSAPKMKNSPSSSTFM